MKSWVKVQPSSHVWMARLPPDLGPGTYRLRIEGENEYGQPVSDATILEILG